MTTTLTTEYAVKLREAVARAIYDAKLRAIVPLVPDFVWEKVWAGDAKALLTEMATAAIAATLRGTAGMDAAMLGQLLKEIEG